MIVVDCKPDGVELMHTYLDGDLTKEEESHLLHHLKSCKVCQRHFHELKRTISTIKYTEEVEVPHDFTSNVMDRLPREKRSAKYTRWLKAHPVITAAAIFFILMFSGVVSMWNQEGKLVVSKQEDLIIEGDTVIVPEGVTVEGDLLVKNGKLKIDGTVDGDVTLVKSTLIQDDVGADNGIMASVGDISGEMEHVDKAYGWIWFNIKNALEGIFSLKVVYMGTSATE